jgi:nucleoside-diphosphate-sugar epimerase
MRKVLITGATGYIGANLTQRFVDSNVLVGIIKRPSSNMSRLNNVRQNLLTFDYDGSTESLIKALREFQPDVVFHLASSVIARHKTEDLETLINSNILFGTQLLEAMQLNGVNKIVNTSTSWQMREQLKFNPFTLYTALKQAFEDILFFYANVYDIKSISLRLPDIYGPNDDRSKILNLVHKAAKTGNILEMSAGEQEMDILYIDDVVDGFIVAGDVLESVEKKFNVSSLSSMNSIALKKIVKMYEKLNEVIVNINWGALPYRDNEIMKITLPDNILPHWKAKVALEDGLRKLTT